MTACHPAQDRVGGFKTKCHNFLAAKTGFMDVDVGEEDAEDRDEWRQMIHCGDPKREQSKAKDDIKQVLSSHQAIFFSER